MQQTKLIQLLKCFSAKEIKQFDNFLQSPYFNKNELLLRFYRLLSPHHPTMESGKLDKEKVYSKLYGPGLYKDKTMRDVTSLLYQLANEFISHEHVRNCELELNRQKCLWLVANGTEKLRGQSVEYTDKLIAQHTVKDGHYYLHRWLADFNKFEYQADRIQDLEHKWASMEDTKTHLQSLDRYYLYKAFETQLYVLSISNIYNQQVDKSAFEHTETLAKKYTESGDAVIDLYYNLLLLDTTHEDRYFQVLKSKFLANDPSIPFLLMREIAVSIETHLSNRVLCGDRDAAPKDLMEIFHFMIKHGLMYYKGEINYYFFQNVVICALKTESLEWTEQFIETYKNKLPEKHREDVYNYCKAYVLFKAKKFDEALTLALSVNTVMYYNKIDIKGLIARIYYEQNMYDQLEVLLDSYKYHLTEGAVMPAFRKQSFNNFVASMRKLVEVKLNYSQPAYEKLAELVRQKSNIQAHDWFVAKVNELVR